jgi:hypothetical protein
VDAEGVISIQVKQVAPWTLALLARLTN